MSMRSSGEATSKPEVIVSIRGQLSLGPYQKLVEITAQRASGEAKGEFVIPLPDVEVDILDDTDFRLTRLNVYCGLGATGSTDGDVPTRPAALCDYLNTGADELAGEPSEVVVRLIDSRKLERAHASSVVREGATEHAECAFRARRLAGTGTGVWLGRSVA